MRFFAGLLAYLVGVSAVISIGIVGLMALQSANRTPSAPIVAVESHKERLAKPVKQTTVGQKKTHSNHEHQTVQKHQTVRVTRKQPREAPTIAAGDAYGYAQEPRRIDPNLFPFFGR
ncbi:MAG: hypothetical protein WBW99_13265 [Pseudolabrys sp.]